MYSVLQNVIFKFQVLSSEGCGRKRTFSGDTEEYHDVLRFDSSILGEFWARNGLEYWRNRIGPYFMSLFPFPCIYPTSNYKYRTCGIVAELISLPGGLSNFDPETLPPSVSRKVSFFCSPLHNRPVDTLSFPFLNTSRYSL
jgi:hypothetical protein